jgi:hypothetical protein
MWRLEAFLTSPIDSAMWVSSLHLIIHFRLTVTIFMLLALLVADIRYRK